MVLSEPVRARAGLLSSRGGLACLRAATEALPERGRLRRGDGARVPRRPELWALAFRGGRHVSEVNILTEGKRGGAATDVGEFGVCHQAKEESPSESCSLLHAR